MTEQSKSYPLWQPSEQRIKDSLMYKFMQHCGHADYDSLHQWSIALIEDFWINVWDFCGVIASNRGDIVLKNPGDIMNAEFFPDARLNYAENLLRRRDDETAIVFYGETQRKQEISYKSLYNQVSQLAQQLRDWGIQPGDRIAGYLPNMPEAIIATLATSAVGAIWSSCSPDFGEKGVIDRFSQIEPKILFSADGYFYHGKVFNCTERLPEILKSLPTVQHTIIVPYVGGFDHPYLDWNTVLQSQTSNDIQFEQLPFNHPLFILYSSGTTGVPKCIVHGAGGTLLQHLKEHQLQSDIKPDDRVFYFATCSWMMWNWQISALASNAQLILYDGSPMYPTNDRLFEIAEETGMTLFGTSAKYLSALHKAVFKPKNDLSAIKTIASTGSALSEETFDYIYADIKSDVHVESVSGGTDIIACFMIGNPTRPVYRGQLQGAGLGFKVDVFDDDANPMKSGQGELVCTAPFPSRPIGFWNDADRRKYFKAYYNRYPNVWHHGDFVEHTAEDGFIVHGRSDAVLKPGGVRIGTAEIYRQVEQMDEVMESLAVGQNWDDDTRIILFVVLRSGVALTDELTLKIKYQIRTHTTPRHVPAKIFQVNDLPRTKNGKLTEIAVRQVIHGQAIKNSESLANPESLEQFKNLKFD
ncbi:MAG: acetoacetate--CoA ligase [Alphaproteobacteria bacterium]|nr:acetoacetate--CoA ligase [Alphaproteobacteria bacterium]